MTTTVVYCNECSPKTVRGADANHQITTPARHWLPDGTIHTDCSVVVIDIDRNTGESPGDFHARIEANHQADMI